MCGNPIALVVVGHASSIDIRRTRSSSSCELASQGLPSSTRRCVHIRRFSIVSKHGWKLEHCPMRWMPFCKTRLFLLHCFLPPRSTQDTHYHIFFVSLRQQHIIVVELDIARNQHQPQKARSSQYKKERLSLSCNGKEEAEQKDAEWHPQRFLRWMVGEASRNQYNRQEDEVGDYHKSDKGKARKSPANAPTASSM